MNSLLEVLILNSKFLFNFERSNNIVSFGHQNNVESSLRFILDLRWLNSPFDLYTFSEACVVTHVFVSLKAFTSTDK